MRFGLLSFTVLTWTFFLFLSNTVPAGYIKYLALSLAVCSYHLTVQSYNWFVSILRSISSHFSRLEMDHNIVEQSVIIWHCASHAVPYCHRLFNYPKMSKTSGQMRDWSAPSRAELYEVIRSRSLSDSGWEASLPQVWKVVAVWKTNDRESILRICGTATSYFERWEEDLYFESWLLELMGYRSVDHSRQKIIGNMERGVNSNSSLWKQYLWQSRVSSSPQVCWTPAGQHAGGGWQMKGVESTLSVSMVMFLTGAWCNKYACVGHRCVAEVCVRRTARWRREVVVFEKDSCLRQKGRGQRGGKWAVDFFLGTCTCRPDRRIVLSCGEDVAERKWCFQ